MPAISTTGVSVGAYALANKFAPRFKGAVVIGGLLGAVVQAIVASIDKTKDPEGKGLASQVASALGLGEYTLVGEVGEYTRVGGRDYAESGMFREVGNPGVGEYTLIGEGSDNATEWARDELRGLDDSTEFAPGEGGVLSGGIFR
jgi:hypothetical protein